MTLILELDMLCDDRYAYITMHKRVFVSAVQIKRLLMQCEERLNPDATGFCMRPLEVQKHAQHTGVLIALFAFR